MDILDVRLAPETVKFWDELAVLIQDEKAVSDKVETTIDGPAQLFTVIVPVALIEPHPPVKGIV